MSDPDEPTGTTPTSGSAGPEPVATAGQRPGQRTKDRLLDAAIDTVRQFGIAGVSARTVASRADCNPAAIYYYFGSLAELLNQACLQATEARVAAYRPRLRAVTSVVELVAVARALHEEERRLGNVTVLAQMLAGAQTDETFRAPTAAALQVWIDEVEATLRRLLDGSPLVERIDVVPLAQAVSAAFVGMELVDDIREGDQPRTLDALEQLAELVQAAIDLGPAGSVALRWRAGRTRRGT